MPHEGVVAGRAKKGTGRRCCLKLRPSLCVANRFEILWDVRVLEVAGIAPDVLAIVVTIEDDVVAIVFAVGVIF